MLLKTFLRDEYRLLTFCAPSASIREHSSTYLAFGLFLTWAAGVGRYWDSADATLWQHLGLGSIAYVFFLTLVLRLLVAPLGPKNWTYRNVLLFVALTSPPALLYAVPVEIWLSPSSALAVNSGFLAIVAVWRVALLVVFLKRTAGLRGSTILVATLLPLALIVDGLAFLSLEHVVYETMAGDRDSDGSGGEATHTVVQFICVLSAAMTPVFLAYYVRIAHANRTKRKLGIASSGNRFHTPLVTTT